jgi:hypothetical protein
VGKSEALTIPAAGWTPRWYQKPAFRYLVNGGRLCVPVWHRRAGKDEFALNWTCYAAHKRIANYWHMLPSYEQCRKAMWNAVNPHTGIKRVDEAFPQYLRKRTIDQQMLIEFHCGSTWQLVGSDNYNTAVGSSPAGIVYSEWSLADPAAHAYLSPILRENNGWALFIYTARGYNHGYSTLENAKADPTAFGELLTVDDTHVISQSELESDRREKVAIFGEEPGDALWRQEWFNDFSAANLGSVLGSGIEAADKEGRLCDFEVDSAPVHISCDLGFRDTAAWWFWVPRLGGFDLVDYIGESGLDADDWIVKLQMKPYTIAKVWLPHDARVKTFQSKHSSVERFLAAFGADRVGVVPQTKVPDRINAARRIVKRCRIHRTNCAKGLDGLRSWSYEWNPDTKTFGRDPEHNWASHPGDSFSYGAQVMEEMAAPVVVPDNVRSIIVGGPSTVTMNDLWTMNKPKGGRI